jgi:ribosomal protein S18 acetylase RimI-like enzyme
MDSRLDLRPMTRAEVDLLVDWAAAEGWNPGLHDAELFWRTDPEAFVAAEHEGELVGGGAITAYGRRFGFMGFFIVRPEHRGQGLGNALWHARRQRLLERLEPGATVGMDGVFAMQPYYAKGGFVFAHRDIRFEGRGEAVSADPALVPLTAIPFGRIAAYDLRCFPAPRVGFLRDWIGQPDSHALGVLDGDRLRGFGVIRRCRVGSKIGPLFADDGEVAERLFTGLAGFAPGDSVYLDVPESNSAGLDLVARHGMREVFGCARMYLGPRPALADQRVFGVTTFELG